MCVRKYMHIYIYIYIMYIYIYIYIYICPLILTVGVAWLCQPEVRIFPLS